MNKNLWFLCMFLFLFSTGWSQDWPGWRGANRDGKVTGFQAPEKWTENLTQVWQLNVGLGDASMAMVGGKLYLNVEQEGQETALCIDAKSGKELWKTILNPSIELTGGAASHPGPRATPEVGNGKVYTLGTGGQVHCLDAETGKIIWKNLDFTEVPVFYVSMSPLLTDGMCITHLNGHDNGKVVAFNTENGDIIWTLENQPSTYASPVLMEVDGEEFIVLQTETDLLGISKKGALLWKIPTPGEQRFYNSASPVIDGQNCLRPGSGNKIVQN